MTNSLNDKLCCTLGSEVFRKIAMSPQSTICRLTAGDGSNKATKLISLPRIISDLIFRDTVMAAGGKICLPKFCAGVAMERLKCCVDADVAVFRCEARSVGGMKAGAADVEGSVDRSAMPGKSEKAEYVDGMDYPAAFVANVDSNAPSLLSNP